MTDLPITLSAAQRMIINLRERIAALETAVESLLEYAGIEIKEARSKHTPLIADDLFMNVARALWAKDHKEGSYDDAVASSDRKDRADAERIADYAWAAIAVTQPLPAVGPKYIVVPGSQLPDPKPGTYRVAIKIDYASAMRMI